MQTNIYLSDESEERLDRLRIIARKNDIALSKEKLIELSLKVSAECVKHLDKEDFKNLFNLKK